MTTYYVDGNSGNDNSGDGSSNRPWKSLDKATRSVGPGDEVRIRTGTYHERVRINTANTTWKADTGHQPVIDGRYHEGLFRDNGTLPHPEPGSGFLPEGANAAMVNLRADGIVFDGLTVQNLSGTGVAVSNSNCVVRNCRFDFTYDTAVRVNTSGSFIDNVVIENNICTRQSVRYYDPLRSGGKEAVTGVLKMGRTRDGIIRNNVLAYGHGEGINIGKASYRILVEGNIVHTCNHVHLYINRSIDVTIRNNLVYHLYVPDYVGEDGKPPAGIAIGDENAKTGTWPPSSGGQIYNNIVIGLGTLFSVRNNAHNYNTQLDNCYVGYNTFIGREKTAAGIQIIGNAQGRPHRNSLFENNIILGGNRISQGNGDISGVAFRNNLWGEQPEPAMRGAGDRIGDPNLVNAGAGLNDNFPNPDSNLELRNYQLTERSGLAIARASDGSRVNGVQPPPIRKDFFGANRDAQPDIGAHEYDGVVVGVTANFSIGPGQAAGQIPHTVDFTDKSTAARTIVSRAWDFGDGNTSDETNPSHTYISAGTFDVTLTVTDDQGNTDSLTRNDVVAVTSEPDLVVPDVFRRFVLMQSAPPQVLAYGTQYPDLRCVLIWNDDPFHILNFADIEEVEGISRSLGETELQWIDPSEQDEPQGILDEELDEEAVAVAARVASVSGPAVNGR